MKNYLFRGALLVILTAAFLLLISGIQRYGSLDGLWRRASAEVTARLPHPAYVPTPLPLTRSARPALAVSAAPAATTTASPAPVQLTPMASPSVRPIVIPAKGAGPTPTPVRMAASSPTRAHTHTPTPLPTALPAPTALPPTVQLTGLTHVWQTWNNCGPATLAMNLSYFGSKREPGRSRRRAAARSRTTRTSTRRSWPPSRGQGSQHLPPCPREWRRRTCFAPACGRTCRC